MPADRLPEGGGLSNLRRLLRQYDIVHFGRTSLLWDGWSRSASIESLLRAVPLLSAVALLLVGAAGRAWAHADLADRN